MTPELVIELAAIAAIVLVAGVAHSIIGFGFGIIALAFLPMVIDVRMAHIMLSLTSLPMLLMAAWAYRKGIDWPSLVPALMGAALLMPIGLMAFSWMSMDWLVRGTGLAILATTLNGLRKKKTVHKPSAHASQLASFFAGALSGFLGGAVSIAGPPVATFALNQGWNADRFKSFVTQCILVICIYKVSGLALGGLIQTSDMTTAIWATPFTLVGIQLGAWVSKFIDPDRFKAIVAVVLLAVACLFLLRGSPAKETKQSSSDANVSVSPGLTALPAAFAPIAIVDSAHIGL
ncbi:sulfite exporter TauE/SafE family protein [Planctomycetes bacterium K23_9]|uniref:Probable membrane transporter protein n=1 Tax=Stieleria marina TaxID=1930275 RepID=A0A517NRQ6_9BACT|nr:Sulfite exporter TauE/SafE [Planctomycetes bacterium K23_9]